MALDGIFLREIVKELKDSIIDGKVDKVNQPEKDEILLTIRSNRNNVKLLISSSPIYPKIHLTNVSKDNPIKAPMFCMVLRKYIKGGRILNIEQLEGDRIVKLTFSNQDELGFDSIYNLYVEIMGRHSNITLVRERDNIIMDSIKHITPDINRVRILLPSQNFISAPSSLKLNPNTALEEDLLEFIKNNNIEKDENIFKDCFTGVSFPLSKELFNRYKDNILEVFEFFKEDSTNFFLYEKGGKYKDFSPIPLSYMEDYQEIPYKSPSELLESFYGNKDKNDRLNSKSSNLQKIINTNIERCNKKISILEDNLLKAKDKDKYKLKGELLTANIYQLKENMSKIVLENYYTEDLEKIEITLNPQKSPSGNIQSYYKKYNKLKTTEIMSSQQLIFAKEELTYLQSVLTNIINCDNYKEIDEIRKELIETNYIKYKVVKKGKEIPAKPMHFKISEDINIYVGKNNIQNDYLTLKFADKQDLWFHTKDIPGSHVIIKGKDIDEETIKKAAELAAFYSKGRTSSKVPVDYALVKYVKKPNGAKPGMVIYTNNKTIYVTPPKEIKEK